LDDIPSQGCLKLISQGASLIIKEIDELLKMLGAIPQLDVVDKSAIPEQLSLPIPPELQQVLNAIATDALPFDLIIQQTGMNAGSVSSALLQLELMGIICQLPGMRYQKC
jgi:DNA processing protein